MSDDAPKKRSRVLDALENPGLLTGQLQPPLTPAPAATVPSASQESALNALKRKLLESPTRASTSQHASGSGSAPKKHKQATDVGLGVGQSPLIAALGSSFGQRIPSNYDTPRSAGSSSSAPCNTQQAHPLDFTLNYDNETPIRQIDMGGKDQPEKLNEFVTKSMKDMNHGRSVRESLQALGLRNLKDVLPGLEVRLLEHQVIGVSWMLDQERKSPHKGGILADDMGLGKTVQMIATMAVNLPEPDPDDEDRQKTTLIVVPAALLHQWKEELETKANGMFDVHIHHGKDKLKKLGVVKSKDVIITTYQTLNLDFSIPSDVESCDEARWLEKHGGVLAQTKWYRVVLDEAQFIRNRGTRSSRAVAMLRSRYRWALTGTPITNSLADIYGLIRFGHFRPWNDWEDFDKYITKTMVEDSVLAGLRAQEILKPLLLRRTKESKREDGSPLLQLLPKTVDLVQIEFSEDERELYESVERKARIQINRFMKRGTLLKNNAAVLTMILRLRQLCCHPYLILSHTAAGDDPSLVVGSESEKELSRALVAKGSIWVKEVKKRFLARARAAELDFPDEQEEDDTTCPVCQDLYMNGSGRVLGCGHEMCFECVLELSNSPLAHEGEIGHGDDREKEYEIAAAKGLRPCPKCKKMNDLTPKKIFQSHAFEPSDEELRAAQRDAKVEKRGSQQDSRFELNYAETKMEEDTSVRMSRIKAVLSDDSDDDMPDLKQLLKNAKLKDNASAKGKWNKDDEVTDLSMDDIFADIPGKSNGNDSDIEMDDVEVSPKAGSSKRKGRSNLGPLSQPSEAMLATWRKGDDDMEASAKMVKLMELIKEWEVTGDKTIVYSQWTSMLDLVDTLFGRYGLQSLRYDGKMDRAAREKTLSEFRKPGGPRVILISIKCGGVGLNLVSANRIINLDLSWNYATESQAYDRVHRLGQEKEVFVKRLVVRDTLEERMLRLQDVKVGLAEAALGEGTGTRLHKLSVKEIKLLFGFANISKNGRGDD